MVESTLGFMGPEYQCFEWSQNVERRNTHSSWTQFDVGIQNQTTWFPHKCRKGSNLIIKLWFVTYLRSLFCTVKCEIAFSVWSLWWRTDPQIWSCSYQRPCWVLANVGTDCSHSLLGDWGLTQPVLFLPFPRYVNISMYLEIAVSAARTFWSTTLKFLQTVFIYFVLT